MPHPFGSGEWELYNLKDDPAELVNLSSEYPGRAQEMATRWERYKKDNGVLDISLDLSEMVD